MCSARTFCETAECVGPNKFGGACSHETSTPLRVLCVVLPWTYVAMCEPVFAAPAPLWANGSTTRLRKIVESAAAATKVEPSWSWLWRLRYNTREVRVIVRKHGGALNILSKAGIVVVPVAIYII